MNKRNFKKNNKRIIKNLIVLQNLKYYCKQCGKCCEVLMVNASPELIKSNFENHPCDKESKFYYENLINISQEKAIKINPYLEKKSQYFYTCKQYDKENKKCKSHNTFKPYMCSGYPIYSKNRGYNKMWLKHKPDYNNKCGYWS